MKNLKNKKKGFTLIELIIVIAIIAILAAVALPKFGEVRENANIKSDIANAKNIQSAVVALVGDGKIETGLTTDIALDTAGISANDGKDIADYLQNVPVGKGAKNKGAAFLVEVDEKGNVTVKLSKVTAITGSVEEVVYPQPATGTYKAD